MPPPVRWHLPRLMPSHTFPVDTQGPGSLVPRPFSLLILWAGTGQGAVVQIPAIKWAAAQLAALLPWVPLPGQRGGGAAAGARVQMFCFWTAQLNWRCAGSAAKDPSLKTWQRRAGRGHPARDCPAPSASRRGSNAGSKAAGEGASHSGPERWGVPPWRRSDPRQFAQREVERQGARGGRRIRSGGGAFQRATGAFCGAGVLSGACPGALAGGRGLRGSTGGGPRRSLAKMSPSRVATIFRPAGGAQLGRCQPGRRPHSSTLDSGRGRAAARAPPIKIAAAPSGSALAAAAHGPRG